MRFFKLLLVLLAIAELAAFVAVAQQIGLMAALLLAAATSIAGIVLLRMVGHRTLAQIRAVAEGRVAEADRGGRFFTVAAGILLVLPGFVTDLIGLLLLLPPLQKALRAAVGHAFYAPQPQRTEVVDLEPGEWNRVADRDAVPAKPAQSLSPTAPCVSHTGEQDGAP